MQPSHTQRKYKHKFLSALCKAHFSCQHMDHPCHYVCGTCHSMSPTSHISQVWALYSLERSLTVYRCNPDSRLLPYVFLVPDFLPSVSEGLLLPQPFAIIHCHTLTTLASYVLAFMHIDNSISLPLNTIFITRHVHRQQDYLHVQFLPHFPHYLQVTTMHVEYLSLHIKTTLPDLVRERQLKPSFPFSPFCVPSFSH